ncbi:hypothetical protein CEXT_412611 [Caerostris extrusa]|uniref:Uncharacterized protein n=1 Tax=Caerostris extrusa TaxID=172846 RepID=A0AAV4P1R1_CAEEX|nr:hypothetical protein CEXT_412611 [Caerostris extrusa]
MDEDSYTLVTCVAVTAVRGQLGEDVSKSDSQAVFSGCVLDFIQRHQSFCQYRCNNEQELKTSYPQRMSRGMGRRNFTPGPEMAVQLNPMSRRNTS